MTFHKHAGLAQAGEGALLGLLLGVLARQIPTLSTLRQTNPSIYDAALGASVLAADRQLSEQSQRPSLLPGQDATPTFIQPPPWNLM